MDESRNEHRYERVVKGRSKSKSVKTGIWTKRDTSTGRFADVRISGSTFKGVRRER